VDSPHSPDNSVRGSERANVNNTKIEIGDRTISVLAIVLAATSIVVAFWAIFQAVLAEREARMLQYYVLEMDAKLIAAGVKKPEDAVAKKLER
jgi:hypothetical protein